MKTGLKLTAVGGMAMGLMLLNPVTASAGLIYDSNILLSAQGFGTAPRDLTIEGQQRNAGFESGCVGYTGTITFGTSACMSTDAAFMPNGVINVGGDEPNPLADNQKYGVPLESELGITSAADIGILFNATEPQGDAINLTDVTLKLYLGSALIGSIDGSYNFADGTNPGNGVAGFVFVVDAAQQAYVDGLLAQGDIRFALEATLTGSAGGPESFAVVNLSTAQRVPDGGATLLLLGAALGGLGTVRRFMKR